ncbi:hypothetical protein [Ekhidna sp.]|uniref:hypothetical protein n=1 Tax=Ekhidna sp. TaxID=2608089 RepID=UPI0032997C75
MEIFEITGEDISKLNDGDLKKLVGLLCETEYRFSNLSTSGIHWGGNQDAPDGGADVLVDTKERPLSEYIPSKFTVFQVKKPKMPPASIGNEMRSKGNLKPVIVEAIKKKGSYIIVSSTDNTTPSALGSRIKAMKKAIEDEEGSKDLLLDFFDQSRLASWVRNHPSIVVWVRNRNGNDLNGWKPYDRWSYMANKGKYLLDDRLKLKNGKNDPEGIGALEGIQKIREDLQEEKASVRLTGLSGVGKTRFAQALFEDSVGSKALDKSKVIYTDMSLSPIPSPVNTAEYLISQKSRSFLIVDNCLPELHNKLTQICKREQSRLSLMTIEYDVKDDLPDETDVYNLEPSSEELIEKLLENRYNDIEHGVARQIAQFSGGNARLALALANTFERFDSISELKDEELFQRLFHQRNNILDDRLLQVAQGCSLVYSFDGESTNNESELGLISKLSSLDILTVYGKIEELKSRDLVQVRNKWRAILPHALANKLAKRALNSLPIDFVNSIFLSQPNQRLLKSFSKRLGYLHDFEPAQLIVRGWLDSWLKDLSSLDAFENEIFQNIAPVDQEKTLQLLESEISKIIDPSNRNFDDHFRILRLLSYEETLFERCVNLLVEMVLSDRPRRYERTDRENLLRLFNPVLSGTMARPEKRLAVIDSLVNSIDAKRSVLGLEMLKASLSSPPFTGAGDYDFGGRPRGYGYYPRTHGDIKGWYSLFLKYILNYAKSDDIKSKLGKLLGEQLSGIFTNSGLYQELPEIIRNYNGKKFWFEGWVAINRVLDLHADQFDDELKRSLRKVRQEIGPKSLIDEIRAYVLSSQHLYFADLFDLKGKGRAIDKHNLLLEKAEDLGEKAAVDGDIIIEIEQELKLNSGRGLFQFGMGTYRGSRSKTNLWETLKSLAVKFPINHTSAILLNGFINEASKSKDSHVDEWLEDVLKSPKLKRFYVALECSAKIEDASLHRLLKALNDKSIPVDSFKFLAWGRNHEGLSDENFEKIIEQILLLKNCYEVALEIVYMRLNSVQDISENIKLLGIKTLLDLPESDKDIHLEDHMLSEIVKKCLNQKSGEIIETLVRKERKRESHYYPRYDNTDYLTALAKCNPTSFLNGFLLDEGGELQDEKLTQISFSYSRNPIEEIQESDLLEWVKTDSESRFPAVLYLRKGYYKKNGEIEWTPLAYSSLNQSYDLGKTLQALEYSSQRQNSISGGGSDYQQRIRLATKLIGHQNQQVSEWALDYHDRLKKSIKDSIRREEEFSKMRDQSFE